MYIDTPSCQKTLVERFRTLVDRMRENSHHRGFAWFIPYQTENRFRVYDFINMTKGFALKKQIYEIKIGGEFLGA